MAKTKTKLQPMTRADKNKAVRKAALREELKGREYLRQIDDIDIELGTIAKDIEKLELNREDVTVVDREGASTTVKEITNNPDIQLTMQKAAARVKILSERKDLNFRRLAKVLPDIKAIEFQDEDGNNTLGSFAKALAEAASGSRS